MDKFSSPEYARSRKAYVSQCTTEYFVSMLATDVFVARLLTHIGVSDGLVGIISSFITLSFVIQFITVFITKSNTNSKKMTAIFSTSSIFCFMLMYLVPFLPIEKSAKTAVLVICILMAYVSQYLVSNILFKWGNSYVSPDKRGSFSAGKEMFSLFAGMIFSAVIGYVIDKFEYANNIDGSFLFIASVILVLNIANFVSIMLIKKEDHIAVQKDDSDKMSVVLKKTLGNKNFRSIIVLTIFFDVARYSTLGFMGVFKNNDLLLSVFAVQIINIIGNFARMIISKPLGRYSDKNSYIKGFSVGLYLLAGSYVATIFTTKSTWFLIILQTILYHCSVGGTNYNSFNIVYSYVDSKYIVHAMAIKNCIGGLFGFGASVLGGKILDTIQANGNMVFGIHIYGQQLLAFISLCMTVVAIVYINKVIVKQKVMIQ